MLRTPIQIKHNMPPFRKVSPMIYYSAWTFALLNIIFLPPPFFFGVGARGLPLVGLLPQATLGAIFLVLGIVMVYALITNRWKLIRLALICGLFFKAIFAWGLVLTLFSTVSSSGVVGLWIGLMIWQALCIMYFSPEVEVEDGTSN